MKREADKGTKKRRARRAAPVDVQLTVRFKFGPAPSETVTMIDDRRVPMAGSLLDNRDRILRGFTRLLFKAVALQPKLARELWPLLGRMGPFGKGSA
jgi:hypothetical protein